MAYSDFSLEQAQTAFGLTVQQLDLFPQIKPVAVPAWLTEALSKAGQLAYISEKARSEFIVAPILLTSRDLSGHQISIYSGQRLDVAPSLGLMGECDFIVAYTPPLPLLQAPIMTIVEAKKNDIESGLGQCAAQMVGAHLFNQQRGSQITTIYGIVTTGETWQFLKLENTVLSMDTQRYYIIHVDVLLGILQSIIAVFHPATRAA